MTLWPQSLCGVLCPMEVLGGLCGVVPWGSQRIFPDSAGRIWLPGDQPRGRSCDCSGAVGMETLTLLPWEPLSGTRAPQTPTHGRVNGPESFSRAQRGRCQGWGCFPGLQVGSPRLSCILHPSRTRWGSERGIPGRSRPGVGTEEQSESGSLKESQTRFWPWPGAARPALPFPHAPAPR